MPSVDTRRRRNQKFRTALDGMEGGQSQPEVVEEEKVEGISALLVKYPGLPLLAVVLILYMIYRTSK